MDISKLSSDELRELQQLIPQEMKRRETRKKAELLDEIRALAKARGFSLEDLLAKECGAPGMKAGAVSIKVRVKYRHPENTQLQWTGRGRQPNWVASWLNNGGTLDNLAV